MECSEAYRDMMNEIYRQLGEMLANPKTFITEDYYVPAFFAGMNYDQLILALITPDPSSGYPAWSLVEASKEIGGLSVSEPNYLRDTLVMIVWGIIGMVGAFVAFLRREF